jgi:hypothetical protein
LRTWKLSRAGHGFVNEGEKKKGKGKKKRKREAERQRERAFPFFFSPSFTNPWPARENELDFVQDVLKDIIK